MLSSTSSFTIKHNGEDYEYIIKLKKADEKNRIVAKYLCSKKSDVLFIPVGKPYNVWNSTINNIINTTTLSNNQEADLLWMDEKSLIKNAQNISIKIRDSEQSNAIKIQTNNKTGNAVVALKIDGIIAWSWHAWVIDTKPNEQYYASSNETFFDRNLGATASQKRNAKTAGILQMLQN